MDSQNRCIPGIIYIPNHTFFKHVVDEYHYDKNDMVNLSIFYNRHHDNLVTTFPIIDNSVNTSMYNKNYDNFKSIFDAAAIGQYLGGVDPRNKSGDTTGFINETCVIKYNKYKFYWIDVNNILIPHIKLEVVHK